MRNPLIIMLMMLQLTACGSSQALRNGVPPELSSKATLPGMSNNIRFWGDERPKQLHVIVSKKIAQMRNRFKQSGRPKAIYYLALSGDGEDGAFGAGLLVGWSAHGTRPEFEIVTGKCLGLGLGHSGRHK